MSTITVPVPMGNCDGVMVNIQRHDYQCMSLQEYEAFNENRYFDKWIVMAIVTFIVILFAYSIFILLKE